MSRILKISQSDYRIQVQPGGSIVLDTGELSGSVYITGNLDVQGNMTTIESVNTTIKDNILVLNNGESSNLGISLGTSGIQIDRGPTVDTAQLVFDESVSHYNPATNTTIAGTYVLRMVKQSDSSTTLGGMQLNSIVLGTTDFVFDVHSSNKLVRIANIAPDVYSSYLMSNTGDLFANALTTKKFVGDYIQSGINTSGMADVDKIYKNDIYGVLKTSVQAYTTTIDFQVDTLIKMRVSGTGVTVNNMNLYGDTITNTSPTNPLILTASNSLVEVDAALALQTQVSAPAASSGKTKIFPLPTIGPGRSGIYFRNTTLQDELVAKNRALLLSMLF
jgi:hypothetical protein